MSVFCSSKSCFTLCQCACVFLCVYFSVTVPMPVSLSFCGLPNSPPPPSLSLSLPPSLPPPSLSLTHSLPLSLSLPPSYPPPPPSLSLSIYFPSKCSIVLFRSMSPSALCFSVVHQSHSHRPSLFLHPGLRIQSPATPSCAHTRRSLSMLEVDSPLKHLPGAATTQVFSPFAASASLAQWLRLSHRERKIRGLNPDGARIFSGSSHTCGLKNGTPVATLAWCNWVSAGTGRPGAGILWVRWKVWSATCISVWQHVKLSVQIRS